VLEPLTLGIALGLLSASKSACSGRSALMRSRPGLACLARRRALDHMLYGTALLCGIGFTMSLFIGLLAFADAPLLQSEVKFGIIGGSALAGMLGYLVLKFAPPARHHV
jgi:NhaA family Na+:H+ antiporter